MKKFASKIGGLQVSDAMISSSLRDMMLCDLIFKTYFLKVLNFPNRWRRSSTTTLHIGSNYYQKVPQNFDFKNVRTVKQCLMHIVYIKVQNLSIIALCFNACIWPVFTWICPVLVNSKPVMQCLRQMAFRSKSESQSPNFKVQSSRPKILD